MTKQEKPKKKSNLPLLITGVILGLFSLIQLFSVCGLDSTTFINNMQNAGIELTELQSQAGNTVAESYYNEVGYYNYALANVEDIKLTYLKSIAIVIDLLGTSAGVFLIYKSQKTE